MNLKALKKLHFQGSLIQNFLGEDTPRQPLFLPPSGVVSPPPPLPYFALLSLLYTYLCYLGIKITTSTIL